MLRVIFLYLIVNVSLFANDRLSNLINSTVLIVSNKSIGTGVLISDDGKILTNYHILKDEKNIKVAFKDKKLVFYNAEILKKDTFKDLVLIKIRDKQVLKSKVPIKLSKMDNLNLNDKIYSISHPNQKLWKKSEGYIYQIIKEYHWKYKDNKEHKLSFVIQLKLLSNRGISGAAIVDGKNCLIGLSTFDNPKNKDIVYAISIYDIKEFLLSLQNNKLPK